MIIEKDIYQLGVGAFVVDIVKQKGNYKIKSPGWVRDFKSIEHLIDQGVLRVKVDTNKQLIKNSDNDQQGEEPGNLPEIQEDVIADNKNKTENKSENKNDERPSSRRSGPPPKRQKEFTERLVDAKKIFDEAKQIQAKVLSDIQKGKPIDTSPITAMTSQSIDTVFDNPDALACVINIRCKDEYLLEHSVSVSILISIFSRFLKFDKDLTQELAVGAFLHDVGKIMIPDKVINKPGRLTDNEFEIMKTHVVHSSKIVEGTNGISELSRKVVSNHHEKLNGQGYPLGLDLENLSIYDRMITICDIFDALSAHRVYKQGIAQIKAFSILRALANAGDLDPKLVDQFIKCLGVYPVGSLVKLTSNKLAIVESRNLDNPTKPKVKSFYNISQNVFTMAKDIDLAKSDTEGIEQGVRADDFELDMNKITEFLLMQG